MKRATALAAALTAACATAGPRVVAVETDGWSAIDRARPESASRGAVADALRRAVERAAGVSVSARTRMTDGRAASSRMVADAAGCVRRYEVLSESSCEGGRCARVRAQVETGPGSCSGRPVLPPAAVEEAEVSVDVAGRGPYGTEAAEAAAAGLRGALAGRGWRVVTGAPRFRLRADAAVRDVSDPRLGSLASAQALLRVRVETADGRILSDASSEAAAVDADEAAAARLAARSAADEALTRAAQAMEEGLWESRRPD